MDEPVCFRHRFRFDPDEWPDSQGFRLTVESKLPTVNVWVNGAPADVPPGPKREIRLEPGALRRGQNVLALLVSPEEAPAAPAAEEGRQRGQQMAVNPLAAGLESRAGDEILSKTQLASLALFASLEKMPRVEEFPGSIVLRRFRKGEVACFQGEPGHSAFYVLTAEDAFNLRKSQLRFYSEELAATSRDDIKRMGAREMIELLELRQNQLQALEARVGAAPQARQDARVLKRFEDLRKEIAQLTQVAEAARLVLASDGSGPHDPIRQAATAWIMPGGVRQPQPRGLLGKLRQRLLGGRGLTLEETPRTIRNDGPGDVDYKTRCGSIYEGELFGEMACMTLAPRSATVVADRDGYMLEFLRNVFNLIQKDDGYRQRILDLYRQRLLSSHLQHLKFLDQASEEQLRWLSERVEMKFVDAGTVICNEGEPSDCVYLIKAGLVQVVKGVKGLRVALSADDVPDWKTFARELLKGDPGIRIPCPECGNELRLPDKSLLGRRGKCPSCGHKFVLAEPESRNDSAEVRPSDPQKSAMNSLKGLAAKRPAPPGVKRPGPARPGAAPQKPAKREPTPKEAIWNELPAPVQQAVRRLAANVATGGPPAAGNVATRRPPVVPTPPAPPAPAAAGGPPAASDQLTVLVALNDLIRSREFINSKSLAALLKNEPRIAAYPRNKKQWTGLQVCVAGRLLLQAAYPEHLRPPGEREDAGPLRILAYLSGGDVFGETGVVLRQPRGATCIAYDHPSDDATRTPGQVELVVIRAEHFDQLLAESPEFRRRVEETIERYRQNEERESARPVWSRSNSILTSSEFQDRGFIQGRKLMLIDLDACTRCGDCVRACINTHDDGYSRLFLDGPRFDRFLVPSACRNCIDPACMIGCPVGSIQKGDNGQIVIRDWCIGCNTCARQCPYDSIQMHDTGLVPEPSRAWRYIRAAEVAGRAWFRRRFNDSRWSETDAPVLWDLDFQAGLNPPGGAAAVSQRGNGAASEVGLQPGAGAGPGDSSLAYRDKILSVRLDVDRKPPMPPGMEESDVQVRLKVLPAIAVVCDQCSTLPSQEPACVTQCPHEAAMRVEARFEFPIGMDGGA